MGTFRCPVPTEPMKNPCTPGGVVKAVVPVLGDKTFLELKHDDIARVSRKASRSVHRDWLNACKGGPKACSDFSYSARLTEFVLLGDVAIRAQVITSRAFLQRAKIDPEPFLRAGIERSRLDAGRPADLQPGGLQQQRRAAPRRRG